MAWNQMWRTRAPGTKDLLAVQVCGLLLHHLPNLASFTFIDSFAGSGGPIPIIEATLNAKSSTCASIK